MTDIGRIAVIGSGHIGGTVGRAAARAGHAVTFGSRDPAAGSAYGVPVAPIDQAVAGADIVVIAIPGGAVAALAQQHAAALAGKLVIDCTNSVGGGGPSNSHAAIMAAVPTARYARAFNTLGAENLADPRFGDEVADMFFAGPAADRPAIEAIIEAVGLRPMYLGEGQQDLVDQVLMLWFTLAMGQQRGRKLAFRVLQKD